MSRTMTSAKRLVDSPAAIGMDCSGEPPPTVAERAVLVDTGNYVSQQGDGRIEEIENGTIESRWVEAQPGHPVVRLRRPH